MRLVNVIPVAKGVFRGTLSYFTSKEAEPGALIMVPVRKKTVPAIVVSSQEVSQVKTILRASEFSLKPIKDLRSKRVMTPEFIDACKEIAEYFMAPAGIVIKEFMPQAILTGVTETETKDEIRPREKNWQDVSLFQGNIEERIKHYRSVIREEFAKKRSVFFCLPSYFAMKNFISELEKGIEKYSIVMHAEMPAKKIKEAWENALCEKHPVLIIASRLFLSLPRQDIKTFIIERESSSAYKLLTRPYLDIRKAVEIIGKKTNSRAIFGDMMLRTETIYKKGFAAWGLSARRIFSEAENKIAKLQTPETLTSDLKNLLRQNLNKKERLIIFINRLGHSPVTFCKDCQRAILCGACESPLVIHKNGRDEKPFFSCHKCLKRAQTGDKCPYCGGWRLEPFGIGIQKVAEEIKKELPEANLFTMDSASVKTKKQGEEIIKKFLSTRGAALVATEMLFSYFSQQVDNVAVASVDTLFALPDFRINEKIFQILLRLRSMARKTFLVQTRMPENILFENALRGNVSGFYKNEVQEREKLGYPPFRILVKITKEDRNKIKLKNDVQNLEKKLGKWDFASYPAFTAKIKNVYIWHILLKIDPDSYPQEQTELRQILASLPPSWKINIDPESLL